MNDLEKHLNQGLASLANRIEEYAVQIVDRDKIVAWGRLRRSIKTKYYQDKHQIDVYVEASVAPYAQYVHEGRKAGKMPPVSMIEEWARKKRLLSSSSNGAKLSAHINPNAKLSQKQKLLADRYHSLAWAIASKMKHHELKPRRFLIEAILKALKDIS